MNDIFLFNQNLKHRINSIPDKNRDKFMFDLLTLIELAHKDNYEDFDIEQR